MSKKMIKATIDYLIKSAKVLNRQQIGLTMFGGEPTLYPDLCEYALLYAVNACRQNHLKLKYRIITNGMRFDDEVKRFLYLWHTVTNGNMDVLVSLDGMPDIQRINRIPAPGTNFDSGEQMVTNINAMRDWCFENDFTFGKIFRTHSMLTKQSLPHLFETFKYFTEQGLKSSPQLIVEEPWTDEDIAIYDEEMGKIFAYVRSKMPTALKSGLFGYAGPQKGFVEKQSPFHCAHPGQVRAVTPDGDVYTCHRALYNFDNCIVGHINENGEYTPNEENLQNYLNIQPCDKCQECQNPACKVCRNYYVDGTNYGNLRVQIDTYCKMMEIDKKYSKMAQEYLKAHNML